MNLNIGDQVDAYHKVWYRGIVAGKEEINGIKKVRITFKFYNENGAFIDKLGNRFDGLDEEED